MSETIYSREQIERWNENLKEFSQQPRTDFNKKQALETLMETIEDTLETRSYREVADGLTQWGLDISEGSLKKYVTTHRRENAAKKSKRKCSKRQAAKINSAVNSQNAATEELGVKPQAAESTVTARATKKKVTTKKSPATRKATSRSK